jgi:SAM-dependent methyltransferase
MTDRPDAHHAALSNRMRSLLESFRLGDEDARAWQQSALSEESFDDWLTDRVARRPAGRRAREVYGADDVHDFARSAILAALKLRPEDRLLEIGCGGGLLLRDALALGAAATGLDHSPEMVRLAGDRAPGAEVVLGSAEQLPFEEGSFTALAMAVVFFFFSDPVAVLAEVHRVLAPSGRLAVYTTSISLRGTPAAPEPLAHHGHFHTDAELVALAQRCGFRDAAVLEEDGGQLLTARV